MSDKPGDYQVGGQHYTTLDIQPLEVMRGLLTHEQYRGYLMGNVIKYSIRQGRKVDASDDADKARHYIELLRDFDATN